MKNQYIGDIGDYGKYGLLRFLAAHGIRIGINWYLTPDDGSNDGKFTDYLLRTEDRVYDPELFDALKEIASLRYKSIQMMESANLIPNAEYFSEGLNTSSSVPATRKLNRRLWFNNSTLLLDQSDLIFADPDNGITFRVKDTAKGSEKFVLPEEIAAYYTGGKDVVFYCHKGRRKADAWERAKTEIREYIRDAQILVMTYHRGSQRSYIFVVHPDHYRTYAGLLNEFEKTAWGRLFSRERVTGNVLTTEEEKNWF